MKNNTSFLIILLAVVFCFASNGYAQKVGINTTSPNAVLDVNGDLLLRGSSLILVNGDNNDVNTSTSKFSYYTVSGPVAGFAVTGLNGGVDGRLVTLFNSTAFLMTLKHLAATSVAANRIHTGTGADLVLGSYSSVMLRYQGFDNAWHINASHNQWSTGSGAGGQWTSNGNDIRNSNTGNVAIGNAPSGNAKFEVEGAVGANVAIFGKGQNGIALLADWPSVGFNYVYNGGDKTIKAGRAAIMNMDPATGAVSIGNFGDNVSAADFGAIAGFRERFKISRGGQFDFNGGGNTSHFFYGSNQDTYIRGGNNSRYNVGLFSYVPSNVYIQDIPGQTLSGNATAGGDVILAGGGGKVGIRTSAPATPLAFSNELGNKISLWGTNANSHFGMGIQSGTMQFYTAGQDKMAFGYGSSSSFTETMSFYPGSGQLGIGTNNVGVYKLAVNGSIHSNEVVVESGWADYVFNDKYRLPSLPEVEKFILAHKHLPGIPSASEVHNNGLKLGEIQTKMMQKIEELTLYVIELEKKINKLEHANANKF